MPRDKVLIRAKDISILLLVAAVLGILGTQFKRIYRWDETSDKVEKLEIRMTNSEHVSISINTQLEGISKQLDQLSWQLRRMQSNGRNS